MGIGRASLTCLEVEEALTEFGGGQFINRTKNPETAMGIATCRYPVAEEYGAYQVSMLIIWHLLQSGYVDDSSGVQKAERN